MSATLPKPFKNRVFVSFVGARVCSALASAVLSVTIGWHLYQATGNPFDLALVGLMQILPVIMLFIVTGWVVDNFPRNKVLLLCNGLQLVAFLGLALVLQNGQVERLPIFALIFLSGCARAFIGPAMQSVLPNIVAKSQLSKAVAITSTCSTSAMTAGPFLAGLILVLLDFYAYWLLVVFTILALLLLTQLPDIRVEQQTQRSIKQLTEGIGFVFSHPIVLPSITLDLFIILFGSVVALLPVFAVDVLGVGPEALGLLRAMPALGAVVAGAVMSRWTQNHRAGARLFWSLLVFSFSVLVFALSNSLWLSLVALFVYGASDMVSVNIRSTLVHLATPDALRGRVNAVNSLFIATSNDLGDFRAGAVAAAFGATSAALVGAGVAFVVTGVGYISCHKLRALRDIESAAHIPAEPKAGVASSSGG
ncbi:MFS transporter [Halioxenophilus aromaticivorans]|uniref:MFS transporter n=1 Tax=Halioxenophilus aromaticivorans TaxID=1306992 RepID=UPI0031E87777